MNKNKPTPGSDEAVEQGCMCPVLDNARGQGFMYGGKRSYWISGACPMHGGDGKVND
jgi:hypothetical protein